MSEKPETDELDEEAVDELIGGQEDVDLDSLNKDLEQARHRTRAAGDPAWRRLERLREDRHVAELISDFEDYDLEEGVGNRSAAR